MEPAKKRMKLKSDVSNITDLPNEVLGMIFLKLPRYDVQQNVALVCKRFLDITRQPIFVQVIEIKADADPLPETFLKCALKKIEQVKKVYPNCKIEFTCKFDDDDVHNYRHVMNYSWMASLLPYDSSITKLALKLGFHKIVDFENFIFMENLESLDLDVSNSDQIFGMSSIQDVEAKFWDKFPNLKSLKIKSKYFYDCVSTYFGLINFGISNID